MLLKMLASSFHQNSSSNFTDTLNHRVANISGSVSSQWVNSIHGVLFEVQVAAEFHFYFANSPCS